ncbi:MAG: ATP-grasp domain-containing protein [Gammaproteobacteria bacterium]
MNILIFEYITGGGLIGETLPSSLVSEGDLMLNAVVDDFTELANVKVLRDYRLSSSKNVKDVFLVNAERGYGQLIDEMEDQIDALLIIAPESDAILARLCEKYSCRTFILLNSAVGSIELTANKLSTYLYFQSKNIAQIPTYEISNMHSVGKGKVIIKPKDGVGCENLYIYESIDKADIKLQTMASDNYIVQPYVQGQSASLSLLCWNGKCLLLSANIQNIKEVGGSLELKQCVVNSLDCSQFIEFSNHLIKAIAGLKGYIGVDILITENEILLIEINPRLTTSYAGLKAALGVNPAELILKTFVDQKLP